MYDFDPNVPLVMDRFKTVLGHDLTAGTPLTIVDEPKKAGEVDEGLARRLFVSCFAVAASDRLPTPVETEEQAKAREASALPVELPAEQEADPVDPVDDNKTEQTGKSGKSGKTAQPNTPIPPVNGDTDTE